jgi:hypothetical protein
MLLFYLKDNQWCSSIDITSIRWNVQSHSINVLYISKQKQMHIHWDLPSLYSCNTSTKISFKYIFTIQFIYGCYILSKMKQKIGNSEIWL